MVPDENVVGLFTPARLGYAHDWIFDHAEAASVACKKLATEVSRREQRLIQGFSESEHKVFRGLLARAASNAAAMDAKQRNRN